MGLGCRRRATGFCGFRVEGTPPLPKTINTSFHLSGVVSSVYIPVGYRSESGNAALPHPYTSKRRDSMLRRGVPSTEESKLPTRAPPRPKPQ